MSALKPLPKTILDRAKNLKITKISIEFQGGGDEGYWYIDFERDNEDEDDSQDDDVNALESDIEHWADNVYGYSGDGSDHGYDIMYDLENMTATHEFWAMERAYDDEESASISIDEDL